jgi:hypothetical protein
VGFCFRAQDIHFWDYYKCLEKVNLAAHPMKGREATPNRRIAFHRLFELFCLAQPIYQLLDSSKFLWRTLKVDGIGFGINHNQYRIEKPRYEEDYFPSITV